jgi:hypothetical protein
VVPEEKVGESVAVVTVKADKVATVLCNEVPETVALPPV